MVHRDIKPGNILLDKRHTAQNPMGEPVLTDFGIAKLMGAGSTLSGRIHSHKMLPNENSSLF
jgi:serine/threonine protein kinase